MAVPKRGEVLRSGPPIHWLAVTPLLIQILGAHTVRAAVIRVPAERPTIQEAIDVSSNGDTILVASGVYVGGIDFLGKDISVESEGGPELTTLDGNRGTGVVIGPGGALIGFTITNSFAPFGA